MSMVNEAVFTGDSVSFLLTSRYVDSPCVGVDLLTQRRSKLRHQQEQQRPEQQLQKPEPGAYRGRRRAKSHGFSWCGAVSEHSVSLTGRGCPRCMQRHGETRKGTVTAHQRPGGNDRGDKEESGGRGRWKWDHKSAAKFSKASEKVRTSTSSLWPIRTIKTASQKQRFLSLTCKHSRGNHSRQAQQCTALSTSLRICGCDFSFQQWTK